MTTDKDKEILDGISDDLFALFDEQKYPLEHLVASMCNVYCHLAAEAGMTPDIFIRMTMEGFAEQTGGKIVFMSRNDLEERESATLQ